MRVERLYRRPMQNSTLVSSFVLSAYFNLGSLRFLFFSVLLLLYALILSLNVLLIGVIGLNRSLHEPMYIFLCGLFLNELYGSTALFLFLLLQILRDVHVVLAPFCFLQIYSIHSYGTVEFITLAVMSYDRYLAICHPLHYKTRMTRNKTMGLLVLPWAYSLPALGIIISLSSSLRLCGDVIDKVYCDNYSVVKLACSDTTVINAYGIFTTFIGIVIPVATILYTYIRILMVCFAGLKHRRQKAVSTCSPHLASVLNFSVAVFFELLQSRFNMSHVPNMLRVFLSLYFLLCQPLFNPLIYGLVLTKIRRLCKSLFFRLIRKCL